MMKLSFIQPRLTGERFEQHSLPVEVARDFAAYESLIRALVRHLYLKDHPDRQRVPKGFADNFGLDIERIDEGSTRPLLSLVMAGMLDLQGGAQTYFERARDLVTECIAAPEGKLPVGFPLECLAYFNQFGRSLREGEAMELDLDEGDGRVLTARLTPESRKKLVLSADKVYEKEINLSGVITGIDWKKSSFKFHPVDGRPLDVALKPGFEDEARQYGGRERHQVVLKGVGGFDATEQLTKLISVESLEVIKNFEIAARLDELGQLKDGWFEGGGKELDRDRLAEVADRLSDYPDALSLPLIVPTQEGNLLLEWVAEGDPSLDIDMSNLAGSYHAFSASGGDIERDFDLSRTAGWQSLFAFLDEQIKELA